MNEEASFEELLKASPETRAASFSLEIGFQRRC